MFFSIMDRRIKEKVLLAESSITERAESVHGHNPVMGTIRSWAQSGHGELISLIDDLEYELHPGGSFEIPAVFLGRFHGDWHADPVKFPHGLRPLAEKARACGIRFGVHVALAQCDTEAPVAKEHPEWLIRTDEEYFGASPLCLGHSPCREWIIDELSALISEEGLDIVIDTLRKRHPALVVENCEDGGCMMTFKMARLYHTSITVDNMDAYSTRQGIYGASYPFSLRYSARYLQEEPTKYTLYSSIFGGPLIFMHRLTEWSAEQMNIGKKAIDLYKTLRKQLQGSKIIHLEAPRCNIPHGGWGWDAIQAVSVDRQNSVVMVYRAGGDVYRI